MMMILSRIASYHPARLLVTRSALLGTAKRSLATNLEQTLHLKEKFEEDKYVREHGDKAFFEKMRAEKARKKREEDLVILNQAMDEITEVLEKDHIEFNEDTMKVLAELKAQLRVDHSGEEKS